MSQNFLKATTRTGIHIQINAGYDRPHGGLFANVLVLDDLDEDAISPEQDRELDSIGQINACSPATVSDIASVFDDHLGVKLPAAMIQILDEDLQNRQGNTVRLYDIDGNLLNAAGQPQ